MQGIRFRPFQAQSGRRQGHTATARVRLRPPYPASGLVQARRSELTDVRHPARLCSLSSNDRTAINVERSRYRITVSIQLQSH